MARESVLNKQAPNWLLLLAAGVLLVVAVANVVGSRSNHIQERARVGLALAKAVDAKLIQGDRTALSTLALLLRVKECAPFVRPTAHDRIADDGFREMDFGAKSEWLEQNAAILQFDPEDRKFRMPISTSAPAAKATAP